MTQSRLVDLRTVTLLTLLASALGGALPSRADEDDFRVFTEHPRLFLQTRRLRLLERERDRQSLRWRQFKQLVDGKAQWPETGFALALYARVSGEQAACREAVRWALGPGADLRQAAVVFDWCQPAMTAADPAALADVLERGIAARRGQPGLPAVRDRVLASIAIAEVKPELAEAELRAVVQDWWRGQIVPAMAAGADALPRDQMLALFEILHAIRDNLNLDLRDPLQGYFRDLPYSLLLSYYPGAYSTAENQYRIPAGGPTRPDPRSAVLARAGDLCLVAFDSNTQGSQFLQGMLTPDAFLMRGALGIPYEFLWANPYLPGLSYHHAPPFFHDQRLGRLYVRSDWSDEATWLCYRDGSLQLFDRNGLKVSRAQPAAAPLRLGRVAVWVTQGAGTYRLLGGDLDKVFLAGLRPGGTYELKAGEEKAYMETADPGGIIGIAAPEQKEFSIRVRESRQ
ncbi:MAG: hypothetical protein IT159_05120 [Bryobacterales bacterium]|nr:hypothetical protein [Bryobacterales bacterium]